MKSPTWRHLRLLDDRVAALSDAPNDAVQVYLGAPRHPVASRPIMNAHQPSQISHLQSVAQLIRYHCLNMTTTAHSGHLTSSLSAADLMTGLLFGGTFRFKVTHPEHPNNDRLIFSKGHASPLFYALWAAAGCINEKELASFRDGPSQMGLEDIALFRSALNSTVLHPCDAVSTEKLVEAAATREGIVYLRTLRQSTPVIYDNDESFAIGGSKVLRQSHRDRLTIVAAGTTVHEALKAHQKLERDGIHARVIDAYSIKPIDVATLREAADATGAIVTVEDHYPAGGLGEAVLAALAEQPVPVTIMAVHKIPMSGSPDEQREFAGISAGAIVATVESAVAGERTKSRVSAHH